MSEKTKPCVRLIYAATIDRVIGSKGKLPFHLPGDLKRFQQMTMGGVLVMGSATHFSIPAKKRPLKGRTNVVLTRDSTLKLHGVIMAHSLNSIRADYSDKDIWIIGGGEVLKQAILFADRIHLTLVHNEIVGDTLSPIIDPVIWREESKSEIITEGTVKYQYIDYIRKDPSTKS